MPSPLAALTSDERDRIRFLWVVHTFAGASDAALGVAESDDIFGTTTADRSADGSNVVSHDVVSRSFDAASTAAAPDARATIEAWAQTNGLVVDTGSWTTDMGGFEEWLAVIPPL
ncbi:hypothetical protein ACTHQN_05780 [Curtobacterium flaccumfaciens]|uniref:hypothetical protein n=1 Tax=Curtobacterium flaccumfaciens TaxID=2035 RepID=UPI003F7ED0E5